MTDRADWFTLVDENNAVVGEVSREVAVLLVTEGIATGFFDGSRTVKLLPPVVEARKGVTVTVPAARPVSAGATHTIPKKFTGESADEEVAFLNSDNKVRLDRALIGTNRDLTYTGNDNDRLFKSLDEWLMAVHEAKQAEHRLACFTAPKERVAVVLDYDTGTTYSLPFRHLYATAHGVQSATVRAWGFAGDPLELLRQVRDHNLREVLVAGKPDYLNGGALDAQPDAELEALWKDDAEEVLAAFNAHTESMKAQPGLTGR
jgi:hypothetical protein